MFMLLVNGQPISSPYVYSSSGYFLFSNKSQINAIGRINAIGQALPPFIVFEAKHLNIQ